MAARAVSGAWGRAICKLLAKDIKKSITDRGRVGQNNFIFRLWLPAALLPATSTCPLDNGPYTGPTRGSAGKRSSGGHQGWRRTWGRWRFWLRTPVSIWDLWLSFHGQVFPARI